MEVRDASFYDLINRGLGNASYQEYVDTMFAEKYNKPETPGFDWEPDMQNDLKFRQMSATMSIYTMATYTDLDSEGPLKHTQTFELGEGNIPRMKHRFNMNEAKIRQHMLAMQEFGNFTQKMQDSIENILFESTDELIGGNYNSLKYQRHQAVSKGKFEIIAENNPQGIKGVSIDFNVPTKNKWTIAWFNSDGTEKTGIDPMNDLKTKVKYIRRTALSLIDHVEVNVNTWDKFLSLDAVRKSLGYLYNALVSSDASALQQGKLLLDDQAKALVERHIGCPITVIDSISVVEKFNTTSRKVENTSLESFEEYVFVFIPSQTIGSIIAVTPIVINDPAARFAFYDGGRTVITQTFNAKQRTQEIASELTALCVPQVVQQMYYLTVK